MRKWIPVLLASVLWFSLGGSVALADGMLLPLPELLGPGYLVVRYHHVTVQIEDSLAVTRVEQEFYNPYNLTVKGRYLFPVPPDAILSGFEATVDGQRQQVVRQDGAATNAELYATLAGQHDPSLLQYADWETLAFDLSLPPGASRRMVLEYQEILTSGGGLYHYHYVLSTERYSSLPLDDVSIVVDLRSSSGLSSLYSSSHLVEVERLGAGRARVSWQAQDVVPDRDFELFFAPADGGFGGGLLTGRRNGQDHLLFLFSPEAGPQPAGTLPKDIVFVVDRSGSMSGEKIEQARNALHFVLGQLNGDDRFSVVSFDDGVSSLDAALLPVGKEAIEDARRFVNRLSAGGSTDLEAALRTGLEILERGGNRGVSRMVVFLTDGLPTAGITDEALIARLVAEANAPLEARLHVFGVGYDVNTHLLDRLAADNGGTVTYIQPGENLELALTGFYAQIAHPLLTDLQVEFEGLVVDDLYPEALPDLFEGSSLLVAGRYRSSGDTVTVRVRGRAGDERREYLYRFGLRDLADRDFVSRLWATRRVGALLDRVRVEGSSQVLVDEIRQLGLDYGIVTPYTSFVIEGQALGAASAENMALYGSAELNQASGRVTIQARVQNQDYQQAAQAELATGANVTNYGQHSLAEVGALQVDLSLLQGRTDLEAPIEEDWLGQNLQIDRTIAFGSEEYFSLASDPKARPFLQSGRNVVFAYGGEVIAVRDPGYEAPGTGETPVGFVQTASGLAAQSQVTATLWRSFARWAPFFLGAAMLSLAAVVTVAGLAIWARFRGSS
jgi:Ca-activated chloride channel family protein